MAICYIGLNLWSSCVGSRTVEHEPECAMGTCRWSNFVAHRFAHPWQRRWTGSWTEMWYKRPELEIEWLSMWLGRSEYEIRWLERKRCEIGWLGSCKFENGQFGEVERERYHWKTAMSRRKGSWMTTPIGSVSIWRIINSKCRRNWVSLKNMSCG